MIVGYDYVVLVAGFITAAAFTDYRTRKIPNWLTVPTAVLGLLYHSFAPNGFGPWMALAGFAIGFGLLLLPWLLGGGGMGDVKMLAALGSWLGPIGILVAFACGAGIAALMAMSLMFGSVVTSGISSTQRKFLTAGANGGTVNADAKAKKTKRVLPFAIPVAIGTYLTLAWMLLRS
ncbi:prepilin peptidase [Anatilimnocola floriformis]|uniref:prepilin peptidase n=1 Tax=Anatilimnocola floriformis TaxID=2948575 RepID=UPI0020C50858|nr:A24 family peptidase [Anatilimnocola floriformis]